MRFRLLRRRLTISAPSMAIRSDLPWPFRWVVTAVALGFSAAIGLWAFEFGKDIAGLDGGAKEELTKLRAEKTQLLAERDKAQSIANTSGSVLIVEKAAQEKLSALVRKLETENRALRDDLGFFERLLPAANTDGVSIRGLQAEVLGTTLKWQVLLMQANKSPSDFTGTLELNFSGTLAGKPWTGTLTSGPQAVSLRQYKRFDGVMELPQQVVVRSVNARLMNGTTLKATQSIKL